MDLQIKNLVYQLLPPHKRLPMRLEWLAALLAPLMDLWTDFHTWRSNTRMMANVNSQVGVFENYLRKKYQEPIAIKIESYRDGLMWVPLASESEEQLPEFQSDPAQGPGHYIPLHDEIREHFGDVDFIVHIPVTVDRILIQSEIEKYKQALITYKIIQA